MPPQACRTHRQPCPMPRYTRPCRTDDPRSGWADRHHVQDVTIPPSRGGPHTVPGTPPRQRPPSARRPGGTPPGAALPSGRPYASGPPGRGGRGAGFDLVRNHAVTPATATPSCGPARRTSVPEKPSPGSSPASHTPVKPQGSHDRGRLCPWPRPAPRVGARSFPASTVAGRHPAVPPRPPSHSISAPGPGSCGGGWLYGPASFRDDHADRPQLSTRTGLSAGATPHPGVRRRASTSTRCC